MQVQNINIKYSFGFNNKPINAIKKQITSKDVINDIVKTIKEATPQERKLLKESLGLDVKELAKWKPDFESLGRDIITGTLLPGTHITTSGASVIDSIGNIIRTELARIRGQLTRVSWDEFNL